VPKIEEVIKLSARGLSLDVCTPQQVESAIKYIFGVDSQLVADGTYFVVVTTPSTPSASASSSSTSPSATEDEKTKEEGGEVEVIVAAGGWSKHKKLYGGDSSIVGEADGDPSTYAAKIRAFFVHPNWSRRGIARLLFDRCESEARAMGFKRLELMSTMPGVKFYLSCGCLPIENSNTTLPDGEVFSAVKMYKDIDLSTPHSI